MSDRIRANARHEIKFVSSATRRHDLEQWIRLHRAGFRVAFPPRRVSNVYFDTIDLRAYCENLSGASERAKVRLRWYGETDCPESSVLEVKRRRNHVGWKLNHPAGAVDFASDSWVELRRCIRARLPMLGRLWLDAHPQPVLINRYDRKYFESPEHSVRITLDWCQTVFDQRFKSRPNLRHKANLPDTLVVEIKFERVDHMLGAEVIQGIPIRVSRNSKYMIGVQSILGG